MTRRAACAALLLSLPPGAARASSLAELKPDVYRAALQLQQDILHAQEETQSWAKMADQEADPGMKAVNAAFSDGFAANARNLESVLRLMAELGHLGEDVEKTDKLLADKPSCEMLILVRHDLFFAGKRLDLVKNGLRGQTSALKEFVRKANKLFTDMGEPQDKIKKWEKAAIKTDLEHADLERWRLTDVARLSARMAQVLIDLSGKAKIAGAACPN